MHATRRQRKRNLEIIRRRRRREDPGYWRYGRETGSIPEPVISCPRCGQPGPHFVPPSMGDEGFFTCDLTEAQAEVVESIVDQPAPEPVEFVGDRRQELTMKGVGELRKMIKPLGIKGGWTMGKKALIEAILDAEGR